jgi:hypothetical protein
MDYDQLAYKLRKPLAPYFLSLQSGYAQGTFTPTYEGLTTAGSWTYTIQTGFYTRVGNRCFFNLSLTAATRPSGPAGAGLIVGLPFTSDATSNSHSALSIDTIDAITLTAGIVQLSARIPPNKTYIEFIENVGVAPSAASALAATAFSATATIRVSGHYMV